MQFQSQPLEPPPQALQKFLEDLWWIAAEYQEFIPPAHYEPREREEYPRRVQYFSRHQADRVLTICRNFIVDWYQAQSSAPGVSPDQSELICAIARRFPIVLRHHTPGPLREVMERPEFEHRTLGLVEETLLTSSVPGERYVAVPPGQASAQPEEPTPSAPSPPAPAPEELKSGAGSERRGKRDPRATLLALPEWNLAQLQKALVLAGRVRGRGFVRELSRDTKVPYSTLQLFVRKKSKTLKPSHQAKLADPLRRMLSPPAGHQG